MKRFLFIFIFLSAAHLCSAQDVSNWRSAFLPLTSDTIQLDSVSIIEATFVLTPKVDPNTYALDYINATFVWLMPPTKAVKAQYRVFPFKLNPTLANTNVVKKDAATETDFLINTAAVTQDARKVEPIDFGQLEYNGNFSRGLSFGNAQSLNLNSGFNLQMSGRITDDIEVRAAITDNNIPIQPEGNTARLQEFDKVFIELRKDAHSLVVGDFNLRSPDSYFMKFQRNLQGVSYAGQQEIRDRGVLTAGASFAVSRGNFVRNRILGQEGNQGPYKLTGPNGERFIIVLSGSEKVFIDGQQLKRGANNDYTIDYNVGEVIFTPNRMITQNLNIVIEFEYSDRYYFRSLYHLKGAFETEKLSISVHHFSQQDAKNQTLNQDLNDAQIQGLIAAGDDVAAAFVDGVTPADQAQNLVLYRQIDTIINGVTDTIYRFSQNEELDLFSVNFSYIGPNQASYEPSVSGVNGRVYEYVGEGQGTYAPVQVLIAPQKYQLTTIALDLQPIKNTSFNQEIALSNKDVNTFSDIDDEDDLGIAYHANAQQRVALKDSTKNFTVFGSYEYKSARFSFLERYRSVQFNRDWNVRIPQVTQDHLAAAGMHYSANGLDVRYKLSTLQQKDYYSGIRQLITGKYQKNRWVADGVFNWVISDENGTKGQFIVPRVSVQRSFEDWKDWSIALFLNNETNKLFNNASDTLSSMSYKWQEYGTGIYSPDSTKNQYAIEYRLRYQQLANTFEFDAPYFRSNTINFKGQVKQSAQHTLNWNLTYRNVQQDTVIRSDDNLNHFYLGRIDYNFKVWKGALNGNTLYQVGAGREQRQQYSYLESPDGQGNFAWQDFNDNGVQEIDEFYVSSFQNENRFLRVAINAPEFVPVNSNRFNQQINVRPAAVWKNEKGIKAFIARFTSNTSLQLAQKVFSDKQVSAANVLLPINFDLNDSLLVSNNTSFREIIFFNRTDPKFGASYNFSISNNKTLLTSGFERRNLLSHQLSTRWSFAKNTTWNLSATTGIKANNSDFYFDRRFEYIFNEWGTELTWLFKRKLRLGLQYEYGFKSNANPDNGGQFTVSNQATFSGKYSIAGKSAVQLQFSYAGIGFEDGGNANEQLKFDMLRGLQDGNNYIWTVSFNQTIAKNLQLNIVYDGRKIADESVVNTGRAQISAVF